MVYELSRKQRPHLEPAGQQVLYLQQWFSNRSLCQNHPQGLLKPRVLVPLPRVWLGWSGRDPGFVSL